MSGFDLELEDEPPVCPDEDSALVERIRPLQHVQPTPALGEEPVRPSRPRQPGLPPEADDVEGGWCGAVATERSDGPRPPLTGPRGPLLGADEPVLRLQHMQQQVRGAMQALAACDAQLCAHLEDAATSDIEHRLKKQTVQLSAQLAESNAETAQLRREVARLRGVRRELALLSTGSLHSLQQELSGSLQDLQQELGARTKCCICREMERQVLLWPCQHLALCHSCAQSTTQCPLCSRDIDRFEPVCVA